MSREEVAILEDILQHGRNLDAFLEVLENETSFISQDIGKPVTLLGVANAAMSLTVSGVVGRIAFSRLRPYFLTRPLLSQISHDFIRENCSEETYLKLQKLEEEADGLARRCRQS